MGQLSHVQTVEGLVVQGAGYASIAFNLHVVACPKCENHGKKWSGCLGSNVDATAFLATHSLR